MLKGLTLSDLHTGFLWLSAPCTVTFYWRAEHEFLIFYELGHSIPTGPGVKPNCFKTQMFWDIISQMDHLQTLTATAKSLFGGKA